MVLDRSGQMHAEVERSFHHQPQQPRAQLWQTTLMELITAIEPAIRQHIFTIAINGTSATVLLCDPQGHPVTEPILYNDACDDTIMEQVRAIAPPNHPVLSPTSSFAKLISWMDMKAEGREQKAEGRRQKAEPNHPPSTIHHSPSTSKIQNPKSKIQNPFFFLYQADWLAFLLHGQLGISDYHNSLKLGYDVGALAYPKWFSKVPPSNICLPKVVAPGTPIGRVRKAIATQFGFPSECVVCAGTTDSIAAFLASGVKEPGDAVTSLGSTLVLKLLSETRVDDARYGIYSHRLGDLWLVGGASNTGGAVLRHFFTDEELVELSDRISPDQPSPLDYYPLLKPGERFPINDPKLLPQIEPCPADPAEFLHGLLESMARIEAKGYGLLQRLGATPLKTVYTAGGGAKNRAWTDIRAHQLGIPVCPSPHTAAAYGTAMLALQHVRKG